MKKIAKLSLICFLGMFFSSCSDIFITSIVDAKKPKIITQPVDVRTDEVQGITLSVKAKSLDGGEILYEWFESATEDMEDAESVGNKADFIKEKPAIGTYYYYCKITNKNEDRKISGKTTAYTVTNIVKVIVEEGKYKYTVEHYKQNIEDDGYSLVEYDTDILSGLKSTYTEAQSKNYEGFDSKEIKQQIIEEDGSTVVKVYYDRKIITLTFDLNGGTTNTILYNGKLSGKYGSRVEFENPQKEGYSLSSWENGKPVPYTFPEQDETYVAVWVGKNDTAYKVEHYQQNIADNEYTLFVTENKAGITNSDTSAVAKTYAGFTSQSFTQEKISSDGKTVVKIYYSRNEYTLSFDTDGGTTIESIKLKYGAAITAPENPERAGYSFAEWNPDIPNTMPSGNIELKAVWIAGEATAYKVEHYQENAENNNYTLVGTDNKAGKTDSDTNAVAKTYDGFTPSTFNQEKIAGDGTTVVKIYYARDKYSISFNTDGGSSIKTINLKHGAPVTAPANPTKTGYSFKNWNREIPTVMPKENITITAVWSPNKYTVFYKDMDNATFSGTFNSTYPTEHTYGSTTALIEPTKSMCIFMGWYTTSDCSGKPVTSLSPTGVISDITLYAKWIDGFVTSVAELPSVLSTITDKSKVYTIRITDETPNLSTLKKCLDDNYGSFSYNKNKTINISYDLSLCTGLHNINYGAFSGCDNLIGIIIPNGVTSIQQEAFYNCSNLKEITIPESVTSIKKSAFADCGKIEIINISSISDWYKMTVYSNSFKIGLSTSIYIDGEKVTSITIPEDITSIKDFAFYGWNSLEEVIIPNSVTSIGVSAFAFCNNLKEITIPNSVTSIGVSAFAFCNNLKEITIPNSVTTIGSSAFSYCSSLTEISLSDNLTIINDSMFRYCNSLTSITIPNSVTTIDSSAFNNCSSLTEILLSDSLTTINDYAFSNCNSLTSIAIPNSVTTIGRNAFYNCSSLSAITISSSVASIGIGAFSGCYNIESIIIDSANKKYDSRNNCNAIIETSTNTLIQGCKNTIIPDGVVTIGEKAFENCDSIRTINIPDSVTSIEPYAFEDCNYLTSITLSKNITNIGERAFCDCYSLKEIILPDSLTSIGDYAFRNCSSAKFTMSQKVLKILLSKLTASGSTYHITLTGTVDFSTLNSILQTAPEGVCIDLTLPNNITSISSSAFLNCTHLSNITIQNKVTKIYQSAFSGCTNLTSITIPDSVTSIGASAFSDCSKLQEITLPNNIISIAESVFSGCSSLQEITIPEKVMQINSNAFSDCSSLKELKIPNGVKSIMKETFSGCTNLKKIEIPDSVTSIGEKAFMDCSSIEEIVLSDNVTALGDSAFSGCINTIFTLSQKEFQLLLPGLIPISDASYHINLTGCSVSSLRTILNNNSSVNVDLTLPYGITSLPASIFGNCKNLTAITLPDGVKTIGYNAFYNCDNLTKVTIPKSVMEIDNSAFIFCYKLSEVNITDLTSWCNIRFHSETANPVYYAKKLYLNGKEITSLEIPNGVTTIKSFAFENCSSISSVTIPPSVSFIEKYAFSNCNGLKKVNITDLAAWCNIEFESYIATNPTYWAQCLYLNGTEIISLEIPDGVTSLGHIAFINCKNIRSVTIPSSVISIGNGPFAGCIYLQKITIDPNNKNFYWSNNCLIEAATNKLIQGCFYSKIPNDVTLIGQWAFGFFSNLTSITIPDSVNSIDYAAFFGCSSLTSVIIPSNVSFIGNKTFYKCTNLKSLTFKDTSTWYKVDNRTDWNNKTNGTKTSVTDETQNATWFTGTPDYYDYFWYKL